MARKEAGEDDNDDVNKIERGDGTRRLRRAKSWAPAWPEGAGGRPEQTPARAGASAPAHRHRQLQPTAAITSAPAGCHHSGPACRRSSLRMVEDVHHAVDADAKPSAFVAHAHWYDSADNGVGGGGGEWRKGSPLIHTYLVSFHGFFVRMSPSLWVLPLSSDGRGGRLNDAGAPLGRARVRKKRSKEKKRREEFLPSITDKWNPTY
uniref:Uncharacterized protein n=1 Tax=Oryza glumipatula TaxID=40148 RepID=A0A0D9YAA0_9ORYZ